MKTIIKNDEAAVSPVIATTLMVATTVDWPRCCTSWCRA